MISETLVYSKYEARTLKPSQIDLEATIEVVLGVYCPSCKCRNKALEHGENRACDTCGLEMQRWGNALKCTKYS